MSDNVQDIVVRTLSGESTVLSSIGDITVEQLKLILNQKFSPTSNSPNFHLFFKGVKLKLHRKLHTLSIGSGDFLLLVPFTKKDPNQTDQKPGESKTSGNSIANENPLSKFADSAWSDMMQDLSFMNDNVQTDNVNTGTNRFEPLEGRDETEGVLGRGMKRKKGLGCDDLVFDILRPCRSENILDEKNCARLIQVLGSSNCLSDPYYGDCLLSRRASSSRGFARGNHDPKNNNGSSPCLCPAWLKIKLKAFSFLNIVCAVLQLRKQRTTLACLERALGQLAKRGVEFGMKDLEHLSILSPKLVRFVDSFKDEKSTIDAIVVDCSTPHLVQVKENSKSGCRGMGVLEIFYVLKQRDDSFRTNLWEAAESFMFSRGTEKIAFSSLEEVFPFVNRSVSAASTSENGGMKLSRSPESSSSHSRRCKVTDGLSPLEMVEHLRKIVGSRGQMVHVEDISSRNAVYEEIPDFLSQNMLSALKNIGVTKLYSHQAESVQASLAGKNVVVSTMTSSGKSLCYNLPVLEVLSHNMLSCALYLFPTKALAQDQLRALSVMTKELNCGLNIGIYDGDTSQGERKWLRDSARLIITNPDMLHLSILPYHRQFSRLLSNLKFVIVDEAHSYKGAFGCHTAFILRRLRRLCTHVYGSDPSFIFSTATSANPREHCTRVDYQELASLQNVELIQNDGSPTSRKLFILWNPVLNQANVSKKPQPSLDTSRLADEKYSSPMEVAILLAEMVQHGLRCIAFCKTRKLCELVLCYTREILQETAPHLIQSVCSYRAGYMAEDRRAIERDLFGGKLCGVAATNALELGIDVGHIDVTLHLGFPGSIASLWQQAGRAGRREKPSLAVYVAFESPLDQYFMRNPSKLFGRSIECCHVDAKNQQVLEQHLVCAALEHPLSFLYDKKYFGLGLRSAIESLKGKGYLTSGQICDSSTKMWNYIGHKKVPSREVSIRAIESERYQVIDENTKEILEEVEESKAFFQVYDGAVYMRQGKSYLVTSLNLSTKIALCKVADLKYYTKTRDYTDIDVAGAKTAYPARVSKNPDVKIRARADPCTVTTIWFGFHRVDKRSKVVIDTIDLTLPKYSYNSQAVWIPVPQKTKVATEKNNWDFCAGLHAASHALLNVVPLRIICNSTDLAPECVNPQETRYRPERILLYDKHPGGVGMSVQIQPYFMELLRLALELITSCYCHGDTGCPHCVQSFACKEYNEVLHREAAIMIIKDVLDAEESEL